METEAFTRIKGCVNKILKSMKRHFRTNDHSWNLYTASVARSITTITDENGNAKGITLVILNAGSAASFQEMICDITYATNRLQQLKQGKVQCHEEACPKDESQASRELATRIQIGRLLVKQEQKLSQERSKITQSAAFTTARNITTNYEQKLIMKEWKGKDG